MRYHIHFTYACHQKEKGRLWLAQSLYADSQKSAEIKAKRLMDRFKDAKLVSLRLEEVEKVLTKSRR